MPQKHEGKFRFQPTRASQPPDVPDIQKLVKAGAEAIELRDKWALKAKALFDAGKFEEARRALEKAQGYEAKLQKIAGSVR